MPAITPASTEDTPTPPPASVFDKASTEIKEIISEIVEVIGGDDHAEGSVSAVDSVTLDFGNAGKLTGIILLGNSHYGPNGEEVAALIPVADGYVQMIVPARFVVK